ncbi:hypothetical protein KBC89_03900 [Candidatus Woesebacteria bacterium]|nr:hypothetical protein [Candidatus Woesebacteria bacterium]
MQNVLGVKYQSKQSPVFYLCSFSLHHIPIRLITLFEISAELLQVMYGCFANEPVVAISNIEEKNETE